MPNFQTATLQTKTIINDKFITLDLRPEQPFNFIPGQYVILRVNLDRVVQYSMTSLPQQSTFQLLVEYIPGGQASEWVKNTLNEGDTIEYLGPMGIFTVQETQTKQLLFLATGSGIAPLKSMIDDLLTNQKETRPVHLYFGLRTTDDLIYYEHFNRLEIEYDNFNFHLCISQPGTTWTGKKGRITHHIREDFPSSVDCSAYLCGSEEMIQEATQILTRSGIQPEHLHQEKFW